ncbi:DUF2795 domain-containing protein [Amycolatopsis sp. OK19-0408]|uniref:DUF2795 domain-containing protein n=1 Tax=Amycolatopsis iheyensis TaxID=2945988 RepID=A0A9X2N7N2_9PSEU|nr:DUF2795 domain-containing protein [Amycolatopsis iheyensis]MCR6482015.1 DUF2795 domain-containing protein [Amycolatopsis iheyensis]
MPAPDRPSLEQHLAETQYPCGRDELLRRAAAAGGGDSVLGSLGGLPDSGRYDDFDAVWEAVSARHIGGAP